MTNFDRPTKDFDRIYEGLRSLEYTRLSVTETTAVIQDIRERVRKIEVQHNELLPGSARAAVNEAAVIDQHSRRLLAIEANAFGHRTRDMAIEALTRLTKLENKDKKTTTGQYRIKYDHPIINFGLYECTADSTAQALLKLIEKKTEMRNIKIEGPL